MATPKPYKYKVATKSIKTPQAVIAELDKLNPLLTESELLHVAFFNRAYLIVTKTINQANSKGQFEHAAQMDKLEVAFAHEYFDALNQYVDTGNLPRGWNRIQVGWFHRQPPASLSLLLGANAHINYDLMKPLKAVVKNPDQFKDDYFKVNQLLLKSAKAISKSYYEEAEPINFLKKHLRPLYLQPVMRLMIYWRTRVWHQTLGK